VSVGSSWGRLKVGSTAKGESVENGLASVSKLRFRRVSLLRCMGLVAARLDFVTLT